MWPIYFTAFTTFSFSMAGLELQMLRWPRVLIAFIVVTTSAAIATRVLRRLWIASDPALRGSRRRSTARCSRDSI